jgi:RNA polymerase sigma-70 factor, ECF subfamily
VRIVDNEALECVRRRRRTVEITYGVDNIEPAERTGEINTEQTAWDQPGAAIMRTETRWLIDARFDELPDAFRAVFVLRAVETERRGNRSLPLYSGSHRRQPVFRAHGLLRKVLTREIDFVMNDALSFASAHCERIVTAVIARLRDEIS